MIPRATLLFLPAVLLLACQSPSQGQTTPSPEQIQPSAGTVDPAQPTNAQPASPAAAEPARPNFVAWRDAFKTEALAAGVSAATFDRAFDGVLPNFDILAKDDVQPEYAKPIWAYLDTAVSPEHVATGRQRLADNKAALRKATKPYGVPPQIVIAIWGLESAYGVNTGGYNVIEALATMAYGSRRPDVFRQNLIDALLILEHGDITPEDMQGSWAGAMGQTQFMPAAFRQYAVDGDGDGKRDIWRSLPDVFASTASFLAAHGWKPGEPWGAEVRLPAKFDWEQAEMDVTKTVTEWRKLGVKRADGKALPKLERAGLHHRPGRPPRPGLHRVRQLPHHPRLQQLPQLRPRRRASGGPHHRQAGIRGAVAARGAAALPHRQAGSAEPAGRRTGSIPATTTASSARRPGSPSASSSAQIGEVPDGFPTVALLTRLRALSSS